MIRANPLSRRPDHEEGVTEDNVGQTLLKPKFFALHAISCQHQSNVVDAKLLDMIKTALQDNKMTKNYKGLLASRPCEFNKSLKEWNFEKGLLLHCGKVYVPKSQELHLEILKLHHNTTLARHPGQYKTLELVSCNYWWPGMSIDVKKYVQGCNTCQQNKSSATVPYSLLQPNEVPARPWEIISVDLITQLPESINKDRNGWTAIMVVVDCLTKQAHFFPANNNITALDCMRVLYQHVFKFHGIPCQIISDWGTQFATDIFQEFCKNLGIQSSMSTAYHLQTNGQTERVNQSLENYLCIFTNTWQNDWETYLHTAEFAYNNAAHKSTKLSPFFVETSWNP
jgi:hypothetical protein